MKRTTISSLVEPTLANVKVLHSCSVTNDDMSMAAKGSQRLSRCTKAGEVFNDDTSNKSWLSIQFSPNKRAKLSPPTFDSYNLHQPEIKSSSNIN